MLLSSRFFHKACTPDNLRTDRTICTHPFSSFKRLLHALPHNIQLEYPPTTSQALQLCIHGRETQRSSLLSAPSLAILAPKLLLMVSSSVGSGHSASTIALSVVICSRWRLSCPWTVPQNGPRDPSHMFQPENLHGRYVGAHAWHDFLYR